MHIIYLPIFTIMEKQNVATSIDTHEHNNMIPGNTSDTFSKSLDSKYLRMEAIKIVSNDEQGL